MKCTWKKENRLLNQRNFFLALAIVATVLFALSPIVYLQNQREQTNQNEDKILENWKAFDPPIEITNAKTQIGVIELDKKLSTKNEDWLKGLTVTVHNNSEKAITYISYQLRFPNPENPKDGPAFVSWLRYGVDPVSNKQSKLFYPRSVPIQPGKSIDLILSDERYESIQKHLRELNYPSSIKHATILLDLIEFDDETLWMGGKTFILDENDPTKLIPLTPQKKKSL